jgi:hypothetical protein
MNTRGTSPAEVEEVEGSVEGKADAVADSAWVEGRKGRDGGGGGGGRPDAKPFVGGVIIADPKADCSRNTEGAKGDCGNGITVGGGGRFVFAGTATFQAGSEKYGDCAPGVIHGLPL